MIFDDGTGGQDRVSADHLGVILRELGVRVAVLNACKSARRDTSNVWSSVAAALLNAGVHSVVAMQHAILDMSAIAFSAAFYRALAAGDSLDEAAHHGRVAVFNQPDGIGWGTPVLCVPEKFDGIIFPEAASSPIASTKRSEERINYGIERQRHKDFLSATAPSHAAPRRTGDHASAFSCRAFLGNEDVSTVWNRCGEKYDCS